MIDRLKSVNCSSSFRPVLSFILFAFAGSFVLALAIMHSPGVAASYFDHLLTAVSLVCVSGMVALLMIQVGRLGVITIINIGFYICIVRFR